MVQKTYPDEGLNCQISTSGPTNNAVQESTKLKFLEDTCPFVVPLIPLFWTSGDIYSGFQGQSGQPYLHLAEVYVMYIPLDSPQPIKLKIDCRQNFQ